MHITDPYLLLHRSVLPVVKVFQYQFYIHELINTNAMLETC